MKKIIILTTIYATCASAISAQVGIGTNTPDASAALEMESTDRGLLIPRMSATGRQSIIDPAEGLMVFDSTNNAFYYFTGNGWLELLAGSIDKIADADGDTKIQVEETMDDDTIRFDLGGVESFVFGSSRINIKSTTSSLYLGDNAGSANTTGTQNTLVGYHSGRQLTSGGFNVAVGSGAMPLNTIGGANVAVGATALSASLDGIRNTAVGYQALRASSSGDENTALGFRAGDANNGSFNIFLGNKAGFNELGSHKLYIESTDADSNSALIFGNFATDWLKINGHMSAKNGFADTDKDTKIQVEESTDDDLIRFDVAGSQMLTIGKNANGDLTMFAPGNSLFIGNGAGPDNAAINNIGIGWFSGHALTSGQGNVILGSGAGQQISSGAYNTFVGNSAGSGIIRTGTGNTIIGAGAGTGIPMSPLSSNNTFIGADAGSGAGGSGNVFIGASAGAGTSFSDRLFIDNTNTSEPLIFGNFDTRTIRIYGGNEGTTYYPLVVHNEEDPFDERANGIQIRAGQNTNSQNSRFLACVTPDGDEIGSIRQNGNNTVNFAESSDRRLKTNIQPTSYTLEDVLRIRVSDYSFNSELNITRTGFIAQELYEIFPGAVSVGGEDPKIDPWAVDYGKLTPLLVKAIQDQQKEIENLKAEVAKLHFSASNNQEAEEKADAEKKAKAKAKEEALAKNG